MESEVHKQTSDDDTNNMHALVEKSTLESQWENEKKNERWKCKEKRIS